MICRQRGQAPVSGPGADYSNFSLPSLALATVVLVHGMFDELVEFLGKFPGVVVEHRHVNVPSYIFDAVTADTPEGVEPCVLGEGALSAECARRLVEQAIEGAAFAVDDLARVEVLFDHRRAYDEAMLDHGRFEERDDALLFGNGTPLCVRHTTLVGIVLDGATRELGGHAPAIIGLVQDQLDVVFFGHLHERLERRIVIATQRASRHRQQEHPAVQQLRHCVGRLVLAAP